MDDAFDERRQSADSTLSSLNSWAVRKTLPHVVPPTWCICLHSPLDIFISHFVDAKTPPKACPLTITIPLNKCKDRLCHCEVYLACINLHMVTVVSRKVGSTSSIPPDGHHPLPMLRMINTFHMFALQKQSNIQVTTDRYRSLLVISTNRDIH